MGALPNRLYDDLQANPGHFKLEQHYTVPELARALRISSQALYRYIQDGILNAHSVGSEWRIPQSSIDEFVQRAIKSRRPKTRVGRKLTPGAKRRVRFYIPVLDKNPPAAPPVESSE